MNAVLATALAFARHGHAVVPVNWPIDQGGKLFCSCGSDNRGRPCGRNAAKHPYGKLAPRGLLSATADAGVIEHWFGYAAPLANIGVVTERLIVIDIDQRHAGDESLEALIREHGDLPPTWRVLTGGGGEHVFFACPNGVDIRSFAAETTDHPPLGRGIDIRAGGGYIIAPPSRHISGRHYAWSVDHHPQDVKLALPPDWLIRRLTVRTRRTTSSGDHPAEPLSSDVWSQLTRKPITGYRDMAAAKIAGHFFRHSCDYQLSSA